MQISSGSYSQLRGFGVSTQWPMLTVGVPMATLAADVLVVVLLE
jgi:hypothetical protein